ncbi:TonB-dependent receptor [Parashewanella spongiae]|uniref:TonB-dependent receptor n=1 Tax=Parashewanella spongiae TaxID=342950 RepID=A0A3A6U5E2_9GAMM|nr:TonB-dependent receptor [Parashewanella spongiae]MCL1076868.1 TonB-dependent receptor [Parashewanella spongiae]RJY19235.1 TonB-dependent receptor [Parashewanella spongiae]
MKSLPSLTRLTCALITAGFITSVTAAGKLEGNVRDIKTSTPLQGAIVTVKELNLTQTAGRDGRFFFSGIAAGEYTLSVSYLGAKPKTKTILITNEHTTDVAFKLSGDDIEHIRVVGQQGSLSKSLNRQRAADNLVSIISSDVLGNFPDSNVSEALQRVPGVSIERDQGEGRFVRIRGLAPDFNSVSMNGVRLPAPEGDRRAVALDVVPSDLVQSVEVSKTVTPDMDADALGGSVEVKSLSAFDRDDTFYNISGEASYNNLTDDTSPKFAISYSDIFNETLGVAIAASWYSRDFGSDNVEVDGGWDFDADEGYSPATLEEVEVRDYEINRERLGIGVNLDYRPNDKNDFYFRSLYSQYDDSERRNASAIEWEDGLTSGMTGTAEVKRSLKARTEEQNIQSYVFGGETRFTKWTADYQISISKAEARKPRHIDGAEFEGEFDNIGFDGISVPKIKAHESYFDNNEYELKEIEIGESASTDKLKSAQVNFSRSFELSSYASKLKLGAKASSRDKIAYEDVWVYEDFDEQKISEDDLSLKNFTDKTIDYGLGRFGNNIGSTPIWEIIDQLNANDNFDEIESKVNDFDINEETKAAYIMAHVDIDNLRILTGIRYETADWKSSGFKYNGETEEFNTTKNINSEEHWLPALHLKYTANDNTIIRAAYTNTITRPKFEEIAPGFLIEEDDGELEANFGNPELESLESTNFDLSVEHYFGGTGILSAGVFYKDINNFIYEADIAGRGEYLDFKKAITFINGNEAEILGAELTYVQKFNFLSAPFNNLLLNSNLTWSDSTASISWFDDNQKLSRKIPLPSQSDISANLSLGYEDAYASVWLSAAYKSNYLQEVTEIDDSRYDMYEDDHLQWDFVAKGHITENLTFYFKAINITDEPFYSYAGRRDFNNQFEKYGRTFQFGLQLVNY